MDTLRDFETKIFNRVNPAVKFSVTRYVLAVGIFLAIVIFGLISFFGLGVDLLPSVTIPVVVVNTSFPGATPGVVDQQVSQVIENVVSTLSGIVDLNSDSSIGFSRVFMSFDPSVDKNAAMSQVSSLVGAAVRNLPAGIQTPTVSTFDPNSQPVIQFGITGQGASLTDVADYVQNTLTPLLERVDGVANIQVNGGPTREFDVLLNPDRLRYYNITPQMVVNAITASAVNQPIGTIVTHNNALQFATQNVPSGLGQISQILVDSSKGVSVRDLGTVRESPAISDYARINGEPVVLVSILRTTDSNAVAVAAGVRNLLSRTRLPSGYAITISNDTTGPIQASVDATYRELFLTALVVAIIVLLFLGKLNTALSVILAIPIALSASPVLYKLAGFSLNLVSLLAIIIAIGIVVDDSIVVSENVERYRAMGFSLKESVLKGASEVFSAVVAATLSLLSVLLPVSFMGGFIGSYLQQFSLGLAAAVAFSLLEAVLFLTVRLAYTPDMKELAWADLPRSIIAVPQAFAWGWKNWKKGLWVVLGLIAVAALAFFKEYPFILLIVPLYPLTLGVVFYFSRILLSFFSPLTNLLHGWTEAGLEWVRDVYARSLNNVLKYGLWVLLGSGAFLALSAFVIVPALPFNFVPQTDSGSMNIGLRLPPGTPINVLNDDAGKIEAFLLSRPEVSIVQTIVGSFDRFTVQLSPVNTRPNIFELIPTYRRTMAGILRDQPSARFSVSAGGGFRGGGSALQLNLTAADLNTLLQRNAQIIQVLQNDPYVADVNSSLSDTSLENDFIPDPARMKGTGITPGMIAQALQTSTTGTQASNVITGGLSYPIQVQTNPIYLSGGQALLNLPIYSTTLQTNLQIGQLGSFVLTQAPVTISRYNRLYTGELTIDTQPNAPPALTMQEEITKELTAQGLLGNGVGLASSNFGMAALAGQLLKTGPLVFLLALFLAYLVMAAQFNSWRYPLYLLLPVPLALIGALWLVFILGGGLDIFGFMGMLMLIGLSAKNAILYLDFVVERIGRLPLKEALIDAARLRFRPIVMTTLTVLVISFPLIFGRGQGSEFGQKMGVVMLGGIVFSAALTFFVVPAAFFLFERTRVGKLESQVAEEQRLAALEQGAVDGGAKRRRKAVRGEPAAEPLGQRE